MELTHDVMAAQEWQHNGELIAQGVAPFYLDRDMCALDTTHGHGVWWRDWRPDRLVTMTHPSADSKSSGMLLGDFRSLPFRSNSFDLVAFDPPYMPKGTPGGLAAMDGHYGVGNQSQATIVDLLTFGLADVARVVRPGGLIMAKAGRGIDGGRLFRGDDILVQFGEQLGLEVVMQWRHTSTPRSQKHRGRQKNPRSNYSTLTLFRAPETAENADQLRLGFSDG